MRTAVCPGSFDPVTCGHLDIIRRAALLFDRIIVLVLPNAAKKASFTIAERMDLIRRVTADLPNVTVDTCDGLLADYVRTKGATAIVKGLRAVSDFEYEFQMALINKKLHPGADTVFLNTSQAYLYLSSSVIKMVAGAKGDISGFVPGCILEDIKARLQP